MKLPLPRSRKAVALLVTVVLAGGGGGGAVLTTVLSGGDHAESGGEVAAEPAEHAEDAAHLTWLVTVDPAALPEPGAPAAAPVVQPEGPDGLLTAEQLTALAGASVVRDGAGQLRQVRGDWRAELTELDAVAALPGVLEVRESGEHAYLVTTDLTADQLVALPGVLSVASEDGTVVATPEPASTESAGTESAGTDAASEESGGSGHGEEEAGSGGH